MKHYRTMKKQFIYIEKQILVVMLACMLFGAFYPIHRPVLYVDEKPHFETISAFCNNQYTLRRNHATIPTYHFIISLLLRKIGCSVINARFVTFIIGLLSILAFFFLNFLTFPERRYIKTAQYIVLPMLLPFLFMVYTDILSILLVLLMIWSAMRLKTIEAATWGTLAFFVRQNNILWVLIAFLVAGIELKNSRWKGSIQIRWSLLLTKLSPVVIPLFLFVSFCAINRGIAADLKEYFRIQFSPLQVHVFLATFFILNLPLVIYRVPKLIQWVRSWNWLKRALILFSMLAYFPFFHTTTHIFHPWNVPEEFLINKLLNLLCNSIGFQIVVYFMDIFVVLILWEEVLQYRNLKFLIIFLSSILFLIPAPFLSIRYFFMPLILINAFLFQTRKESLLILGWYLLLDLVFIPTFYHKGIYL